MYTIEAIIFDLGKVIVDYDHYIACKKILKYTDKKEEEIYPIIFSSGLTHRFEKGKLEPREFFSELKKALNLTLDYPVFVPIWNDIFWEIEPTSELIRYLKGKYKLVMMSNVGKLHFEYIKEKFPIVGEFDELILS